MAWFLDQGEVIKVVFQGLKVATPKPEYCQILAKYGRQFGKLTLKAYSRKMAVIRVLRVTPHENVCIIYYRDMGLVDRNPTLKPSNERLQDCTKTG
ncbi:unnamed protein product [Linum trigynum]|uniref:Uncharacterized protein n=1 Tax=Linum trigynum TaxID=586398 RepID=A0AAV2G6U8_9ROSI